MYINKFFFHYIFKHVRRGRGHEAESAGHRERVLFEHCGMRLGLVTKHMEGASFSAIVIIKTFFIAIFDVFCIMGIQVKHKNGCVRNIWTGVSW
jgi:hypothetical protein